LTGPPFVWYDERGDTVNATLSEIHNLWQSAPARYRVPKLGEQAPELFAI